jgi:hypothetical protein
MALISSFGFEIRGAGLIGVDLASYAKQGYLIAAFGAEFELVFPAAAQWSKEQVRSGWE